MGLGWIMGVIYRCICFRHSPKQCQLMDVEIEMKFSNSEIDKNLQGFEEELGHDDVFEETEDDRDVVCERRLGQSTAPGGNEGQEIVSEGNAELGVVNWSTTGEGDFDQATISEENAEEFREQTTVQNIVCGKIGSDSFIKDEKIGDDVIEDGPKQNDMNEMEILRKENAKIADDLCESESRRDADTESSDNDTHGGVAKGSDICRSISVLNESFNDRHQPLEAQWSENVIMPTIDVTDIDLEIHSDENFVCELCDIDLPMEDSDAGKGVEEKMQEVADIGENNVQQAGDR